MCKEMNKINSQLSYDEYREIKLFIFNLTTISHYILQNDVRFYRPMRTATMLRSGL